MTMKKSLNWEKQFKIQVRWGFGDMVEVSKQQGIGNKPVLQSWNKLFPAPP